MTEVTYPFRMSERIIFAEIYFPKRAAYYGAIFTALQEAHNELAVKEYLKQHISELLQELEAYPGLFDPTQYQSDVRAGRPPTAEEASARIDMYQSSFQGWSTCSMDGVFFGTGPVEPLKKKKGRRKSSKKEKEEPTRDVMFEEAVQVVRIMMRYRSSLEDRALEEGCRDVLRSILYWVITRIGRLDEETGWSPAERDLFLGNHSCWTEPKRAFAERYFCDISREAQKWIDDCSLLIIGYLVRQFWKHVVTQRMYEEEVWVTSLFTTNLNVIRREVRS